MSDKNEIIFNGINITAIFTILNTLLFFFNLFLVGILAFSGFEINSYFTLLGFERALLVHDVAAIIFSVSFFSSFALYIFDMKGWITVITTKGITPQKIYLIVNCLLIPTQIFSGLIYFFYPFLRSVRVMTGIGFFAHIHTLLAYTLLSGVMIHLYLIIIGRSPIPNISAILGYKGK